MTSNPILPGFNPDPTICRVGSDYYLATSTFEYFPGVPIYHSRDLVNWKIIGHALNRPSQLNMRTTDPGGGVWAPTLRYHKGRWYMAACCVWKYGRLPHLRVKPRGFFVYTDDIWDDKAWSDPVPIDLLGIDQDTHSSPQFGSQRCTEVPELHSDQESGIDLFFDDDGKVYLSAAQWTTISPTKDRFSTFAVEIDINTGRSLTRPVLLRQSDLINDCAEGPHIFKRGEWYYLLTAEGGTEFHHRAMIFRSRHPLGPYEAPPPGINPLVHNSTDDPHVRQTGHADLVQAKNGDWWGVMLATRRQVGNTEHLGRETFLVPLDWPEDGWPIFNKGKAVGLTVLSDDLPRVTRSSEWRDEFSKPELQLGWYHLRTPLRQCYSLETERLALYGNAYTVDMQESPAVLLRKQTSYTQTWTTQVSLAPKTDTHEAGSIVFWSRYSYIALFLRRDQVVVRWVDETTDETKESVGPSSHGPTILTILAEPSTYTCSYQSGDMAEPQDLITLPSTVIQRNRPFESPYTGAHFGLFAQDTYLEQCLVPAYFDFASLTR